MRNTETVLGIIRSWRDTGELGAPKGARPVRGGADGKVLTEQLASRLLYFLIGIIGSKAEACEVMARVQAFLGERLNLAVSAEKSGVSAASRGLRFLGFHVCAFTLRSPGVMARREGPNGRSWRVRQRPTEGNIKLWVPRERVYAFCRRKRYGNLDTRQGRPRPQFLDSSDLEIITAFNSELRGFANCRVGGGRAFALPPSARSNGSCGFPASRFPVWSSPLTGDDPDPRHQMGQPNQSELVHQTGRGIAPPRRIPPSLGDEGEQASLDPTVETVEQGSEIRLPIVVPPAADDRVESLDHRGQAHRCASTRQVADLLPEPLHRLLTRNGVEVVRVGCGLALVRW